MFEHYKKDNIFVPCANKEYEDIKKLPSDFYTIQFVQTGAFSSKPILESCDSSIKTKLIDFKGGLSNNLDKIFNDFFSENTIQKYKDMKITHQMGIILHGPPGTGKTSLARMFSYHLIDTKEAIVIDATNSGLGAAISLIASIRKLQDSPIVLFIDEVDSVFKNDNSSILTFLDGGDSVDGLMIIGCTNYLDRIPDRIKNRKSRIKYTFLIDRFPDIVYLKYIKGLLPNLDEKTAVKIAYLSGEAKLTIDQLKHILIDFYISDIPIEEAIKSVVGIELSETFSSEEEEEDEEDED